MKPLDATLSPSTSPRAISDPLTQVTKLWNWFLDHAAHTEQDAKKMTFVVFVIFVVE